MSKTEPGKLAGIVLLDECRRSGVTYNAADMMSLPRKVAPWVLLFWTAPAAAQQPTATIGIVTDGPYGRGTELTQRIREEVRDLLAVDFEVAFPAGTQLEGDWTLAGIERAIDQLLADPEVDLVLTLGFVSSHLVSTRTELSKPVIAPLIIDPEFQGLPRRAGGSGTANLNYVFVHDLGDLAALQQVVPFRRVAVLIDARLAEAAPDLAQQAATAAGEIGVELQIVPVGPFVDAALDALASGTEAAYVLPLTQVTDAEFERLAQGLIARRRPSISWAGEREVRQGLMLGRMRSTFGDRLARRTALNAQRALLGDEPSEMPVESRPASGSRSTWRRPTRSASHRAFRS